MSYDFFDEEDLMKNLSDGEDMPSGIRDPDVPVQEDSDAS